MDKQPSSNTVKRVIELSGMIPLDTLGRLVDAVQGKSHPHPMLLPCSDIEQYDVLAALVEILASLPCGPRKELADRAYILAKLGHTREKL
ncbi:MAG: hypothetical protein Q8S19_08800 [Bacillota bacterium]|nr:hypothetical protein [Bacillota bacterium]